MPLKQIFSATLWVVAARWGLRAIGLVSTVILARLLTPADFGVIALAMLVVSLIEIVNETGLAIYIIRHPDPQRSHFDTVFTLQLLVGAALTLATIAVAPLGAAFFRTPEIEPVIQVLALRSLCWGLENPGIIWFRKNMVFQKEFQLMVGAKLGAFAITLTAAILLRSYWALAIGIVAGGIITTILSYVLHPYRPRLSLAEARHAWGFSAWMLLVHVLEFVNMRLDEIIVGRARTTTEMGYYNVASDIAATPVQELVFPMTRVWLPAFAQLAGDPAALERTYRWIIAAVSILSLSIGVGLALVAHDATLIVLGAQWLPAVPVMQILAVTAALSAIAMPLGSVLGATGDPRIVLFIHASRSLLLLALTIPAALWYGLAEIALGRAIATALSLAIAVTVFERATGLPYLTLARGLVRPGAATLAMAAAVLALQAAVPDLPLLRLALSIATGAITFAATLLALWALAGRPEGVERDALGWAKQKAGAFFF